MGKAHDDLVLSLTDNRLKEILAPLMGKKGSWSLFHFVVSKGFGEWTLEEVNSLVGTNVWHSFCSGEETQPTGNFDLSSLKSIFKSGNDMIDSLTIRESINLIKTVEFPLMKGEHQFSVNKGSIDIVAHACPRKTLVFSAYQDEEPREFLIEVKTEKDFQTDFGAILRQIKEYRELYINSIKPWCGNGKDYFSDAKYSLPFCGVGQRRASRIICCVISPKIPINMQEALKAENIFPIELKKNISSFDAALHGWVRMTKTIDINKMAEFIANQPYGEYFSTDEIRNHIGKLIEDKFFEEKKEEGAGFSPAL